MAVKAIKPSIEVIGVESSGAPGMHDSVAPGSVVTLDRVDCIIDGLRVKRVGDTTFEVVRQFVDEIVTLPGRADLRGHDLDDVAREAGRRRGRRGPGRRAASTGSSRRRRARRSSCVLSGGNVNLEPAERPPLELMSSIRIGISACLLGQEVRFDGGHKRDQFLTAVLGPHVEFLSVCPEVEMGLGTPRETLRLVRDGGSLRMLTTRTNVDHTDGMNAWAARGSTSSLVKISRGTC